MARKEWIGEYFLYVEKYHSYKNEYIFDSISLGKCLGKDEACDKAVNVLLRDYSNAKVREVYICDGWGHLTYMN